MRRRLGLMLAVLAAGGCESGHTKRESACAAGQLDVCFDLGTHLEYEAHKPAGARGYYQQACDGGLARACTNLGSLYGRGLGVARDDAAAAVLYRKACD